MPLGNLISIVMILQAAPAASPVDKSPVLCTPENASKLALGSAIAQKIVLKPAKDCKLDPGPYVLVNAQNSAVRGSVRVRGASGTHILEVAGPITVPSDVVPSGLPAVWNLHASEQQIADGQISARLVIPVEQVSSTSSLRIHFPDYPKLDIKLDTVAAPTHAFVPPKAVEVAKIEEAKVDDAKVEGTKVEGTKVESTKVEEAKEDDAKVEVTKVEGTKVESTKVKNLKVENMAFLAWPKSMDMDPTVYEWELVGAPVTVLGKAGRCDAQVQPCPISDPRRIVFTVDSISPDPIDGVLIRRRKKSAERQVDENPPEQPSEKNSAGDTPTTGKAAAEKPTKGKAARKKAPEEKPPEEKPPAARPFGESDETRFTVRLAEGAVYSTIPLDLGRASYLLCQKDVRPRLWDEIRTNQSAAVVNHTVTNNRCRLVVSAEDIRAAIAEEHGISYFRHTCAKSRNKSLATQSGVRLLTSERESKAVSEAPKTPAVMSRKDLRKQGKANRLEKHNKGEARCETFGANRGEQVTVLTEIPDQEGTLTEIRQLYGAQSLQISIQRDGEEPETVTRTYVIDAALPRRAEVPLDFADRSPSPDHPYTVVVTNSTSIDAGDGAQEKVDPSHRFAVTLRPKGPFGITHTKGSLGVYGARVFLTVPVGFAAVRFPAAGLDIESTRDSRYAQLTTLNTGLLLSVEPWNYIQAKSLWAVPTRFQLGTLFSNWYKGRFHPSLYAGVAFTLPVFRGTSQLDTDIALSIGWEVDLRQGYEKFNDRSHLLVTLGMNIFSLLGPESAPKK